MALHLAAPTLRDFILEKTDTFYSNEGDPTTITVAQASQHEDERRASLFAEVTRVIEAKDMENGEIKIRQRWSMEELKRMEVYLTLRGCNITDGDADKPLFRFKTKSGQPILDMSENEFFQTWGKLPPRVAREIHEKVMEVNVTWSGEAGE